MGKSRIDMQKRRVFTIGYICSFCQNPILSIITIEAFATQYYSLLEERAKNKGNEAIEAAINWEISRIEDAFRMNHSLAQNPNEKVSDMHYGSYSTSAIRGITTPCPVCNNLEPWQNSVKTSRDNIKIDNYPTLFVDSDSAIKWAKECITLKIFSLNKQSFSVDFIDKSKNEAISFYLQIINLRKKRQNLPDLKSLRDVSNEIKCLQNQKKRAGFFNISDKISFNKKLKKLEINKAILEKSLIIAISSIDSELTILSLKEYNARLIGYGNTGDYTTVMGKTNLAYIVKGNSIPKPDLDKVLTKNVNNIFNNKNIGITNNNLIEKNYGVCRLCGYKLIPGSIFCSRCGKNTTVKEKE